MVGKEYDWLNLPDGFEFGIVQTDDELEELITFNATIHEPTDGVFLKRLIENLPNFTREMNYFIRDIDKGIFVASINSIPSIWEYDGVPVRNLELGFVGTLKEYRHKGLQWILSSYFNHILITEKYDISTIQGIPYFYRDNFGYDFILPLHQTMTIRVDQIPSINPEKEHVSDDILIRPAEESDRAHIIKLFDELKGRFLVAAQRSDDLWEVQERLRIDDQWTWETMVLEHNGNIDGYFRMVVKGNLSEASHDARLTVSESSIRSYDSVMTTLSYLRTQALNKGITLVEVPDTPVSNLRRIVNDLGGIASPGWKHMVRIPDITKFLNKIRPVLEHRLHGTMFEGLTQELFLNTYRNCYLLSFVQGRLDPITDIGMQDTDARRAIRMPPDDFVRLLLGAYSIDQLQETNIDFLVQGKQKALLTTLFPKKPSYIFLYHC